jgi:hypothetical protein
VPPQIHDNASPPIIRTLPAHNKVRILTVLTVICAHPESAAETALCVCTCMCVWERAERGESGESGERERGERRAKARRARTKRNAASRIWRWHEPEGATCTHKHVTGEWGMRPSESSRRARRARREETVDRPREERQGGERGERGEREESGRREERGARSRE